MILQMKTGRIDPAYFEQKFHANVLNEFADGFSKLRHEGALEVAKDDEVRLTRAGLLQVDRLLPAFFEPEHRGTRYT
jgi:oxygen-independent coproporphyrinogen III oxidase